MSLTPGARLAHYEITELVGVGGMGEVYRARDTKLGRDVAIKVLPEAVASSKERLGRLEREAKLLASLNHANIATLHGLEESDGVHYFVMEFVSGETLAARIERGPLTPDEARDIARQLVDALEAAHENGVIHRDLKPANIKITTDDNVKVLDFGLAKSFAEEGTEVDSSLSPTRTRDGSEAGVILGTAAYMSPEQARGRPVDKRSDIFSFVEMLSAKKTFEGEMVSDILASVIKLAPEWSRLPASTPLSLERLLHRCLEKDPRKRLRDIGDARLDLEAEDAAVTAPRLRGPNKLLWIGLATGVVVGVTAAILLSRSEIRPSSSGVTRFDIVLPPSERLNRLSRNIFALSPDGTTLVYGANSQLYARRFDESDAHSIPGTENGWAPFFSPDGTWLGFMARGELRKIALDGGQASTISRPGTIYGAVWSEDDDIVFAAPGGLLRVSAAGGESEQIRGADREFSLRFPELVPGGKWVLASFRPSGFNSGSNVGAVSIETGEIRTLFRGGEAPRLLATGHLAFVRESQLVVAPFDVERLEMTGAPTPAADGVEVHPATGAAQFAISGNGTLVYLGSEGGERNRLVWVEPDGTSSIFTGEVGYFRDVRFSPDGERVAIQDRAGDLDVWIYGVERKDKTRLTFSPQLDEVPVWSPDGNDIVHTGWTSSSTRGLWRTAADGSDEPELLWESERHVHVSDWTPNGTALIIDVYNADTSWDLYLLPLDGDGSLDVIAESPFEERNARLSPNGKWLAYASTESGREEIYVRSFPALDVKRTVSTNGGVQPIWSRDGSTLFYRDGQAVMAVSISASSDFEASVPRPMFEDVFDRTQADNHTLYDVAPDGRFLMLSRQHAQDETDRYLGLDRYHVVVNWIEEVRQRAPLP